MNNRADLWQWIFDSILEDELKTDRLKEEIEAWVGEENES